MSTLAEAVKGFVPRPIKTTVKDARDWVRKRLLFGRYAPLVPSEHLMFDGPPTYAAFKQNAEEYLRLYIDLGGLKPDEKMLDVGSGMGRKTMLLTGYLGDQGRYEGLDIVPGGVEWCSRRITTRYPQFRFQLIDVYNKLYNPEGKQRACDYRFPFADGSFDFVTLGSVFTHTLPQDTENYLAQISRVLKPGGRCLVSWFLLNAESRGLIDAHKATPDLRHPVEDVCWTSNTAVPEDAIGYDEGYVRDLYRRCGLAINEPVRYGSWCGRDQFLTYQDLILALNTPTGG